MKRESREKKARKILSNKAKLIDTAIDGKWLVIRWEENGKLWRTTVPSDSYIE